MYSTTLLAVVFFVLRFTRGEDDTGNEELGKVFRAMDADGDGFVHRIEVEEYLKSKGIGQDPQQFEQLVMSFLRSYDKNRDYLITLDEFRNESKPPSETKQESEQAANSEKSPVKEKTPTESKDADQENANREEL